MAGEERTYLVDVPESYDGSSPTPLIVNIHGSGSNAEEQAVYSNFPAVSDAIVALPQGTGDPQGFSLIPGPANPDVQFVRQIVEAVSDDFCVDPARVYATGISNGSALSAELACAAPDLFAAIAMVAATVGPLGCEPSTQMPVLAFHGTADRIVPYDGGGVRSDGGRPTVSGSRAPRSRSPVGPTRTAANPSPPRSPSPTTSSTGRTPAATRRSSSTGWRAPATSGPARSRTLLWKPSSDRTRQP